MKDKKRPAGISDAEWLIYCKAWTHTFSKAKSKTSFLTKENERFKAGRKGLN